MTDASPTPEPPSSRVAESRRRRSAQKIAAERQRQKSRTLWLGIAAVAVVGLVVAGIVLTSRRQMEATAPAGVQTFADIPVGHTTDPVTYAQNPPAGGEHDPVWQNCGYYAEPVRNENAVHALEHGAVWITYQPDLPQDQVAALRELAASQSHILVSPMDGIPAPVVASAWGQQLQLQSADDEQLQQFVRRYRLSPGAPEPGASCSGGTSATV